MTLPNIVLVTIDSLRADKCGYINDTDLTPELDAMAEQGIAFRNAVSPGNATYESMPSIWSGRLMHPVRSSENSRLDQMNRQKRTNMRTETLPEMLQRQGYTCGAFTVNPHTDRTSPFSRGFDKYEDFLSDESSQIEQVMTQNPYLHRLIHMYRTITGKRAARPIKDYYDEAIEWMNSSDEPFFLWLFVLDPHTPYLPSSEYRSGPTASMILENARLVLKNIAGVNPNPERLEAWYEDTIRETDDFLGNLRQDLPEDTTTIIHSDHGEAFGSLDHGEYGHQSHLYDENIHVPLVIDTPEYNEIVSDPVSLTDIPDITASLLNGEFNHPERKAAFSRVLEPNKIAARTEDQKYIISLSEDSAIDSIEVYDLHADVNEADSVNPKTGEDYKILQAMFQHLSHEKELQAIGYSIEDMSLSPIC